MPQAYCFRSCVLGDAFGEQKCAGRQDLSCFTIDLTPTCMPNCGGDQDCPSGRTCDHTHGVCVAGPTNPDAAHGDPVGSECDPFGAKTCNANCDSLSNGLGVCSGLCVLGAPYACDVPTTEHNLAGLPICMTFNDLDRAGDTGLCVQRCLCNEDCTHPAAHCDFAHQNEMNGYGVCLFTDATTRGDAGLTCAAADAG